MEITIKVNMENAAFWDDAGNFDYDELGRILSRLAVDPVFRGERRTLLDINGNKVGFAEWSDDTE